MVARVTVGGRGRRIAITGARGRLGSAMATALTGVGMEVLPWSRPRYDLDDPSAAERLVNEDSPDVVIHCAAWVDVDGCARDSALAIRRNVAAVQELAGVLARTGSGLVMISSNEVFDGRRTDGQGYRDTDIPRPANPYGATKLAAEEAARNAFAASSGSLWIVRTAWLYGGAGNDFPSKIVAAADRDPGAALTVVDDELGTPTSTADLAAAVIRLLGDDPGTFHLVGPEVMSRFDWAVDVLGRLRPNRAIRPIHGSQYERLSTPPQWGVLASSDVKAALELRPWSVVAPSIVDAIASDGSGGRPRNVG